MSLGTFFKKWVIVCIVTAFLIVGWTLWAIWLWNNSSPQEPPVKVNCWVESLSKSIVRVNLSTAAGQIITDCPVKTPFEYSFCLNRQQLPIRLTATADSTTILLEITADSTRHTTFGRDSSRIIME